ncbi:MAG: hypothetical protein HRU40_09250 [Saprospiraceae bacterium]|nr:hypothetical protein [Saprospiraceae bacterium]
MTDNIQDTQISMAKKRFNDLHEQIFGEISSMLSTARLTPIDVLQDRDPTFMDQVKELETFKNIIDDLSSYLSSVTYEILERVEDYIRLARNLAEAINNECSDSLGAAIAALDEKPYI